MKIVLEKKDLNAADVAFLPIDEGPYLCLEISDTGVGMEKSTVNRIFDPYFTTKKKGKGTGLGLAVANGLVINYGGAISVKSTPGQGSRFRVFLPAAKEATEKKTFLETAEVRGGREFVLVVDDEAPIAELQKTILESLGYRAKALTDSMAALELFRENPNRYDLLITDMTMPRMTGDKLTREVTRIRPDMPVIICTGFSEKIDPIKIKNFGARELVMKPFEKKVLAEVVRKVLDRD